ncbi:dihydrolipoyllysine-residue succinyltransferase component of 2-oxoglutarate dehydrogenase complex, mitochondrial [Ciona intestinalis]
MSLYIRGTSKLLSQLRYSARKLSIPAASKIHTTQLKSYSESKTWCARDIKPQLTRQQRLFHITAPKFEEVTVNCPPFAESITSGDIVWEKAVGDSVEIDEMVAEIETDKTTIPIPAPSSGVIEELLVEEGATVTPGTPLFKINSDGASAAPQPAKEEAPAAAAPPTPTEPAPVSTPIPDTLPPPPPVPSAPMASKKVSDVKITPAVAPVTGSRSEHRVKMNRMRQRISQRLKDSQNTAAMLTTFNEVDMTNIMALRNKHKDAFLKKHGVKLSFMSAFIKASAYGLTDQPVVNAVIDDASNEIIYRDYVDISIAVSTEKGLVVPVLRNCETMNFLQIEQEMTSIAQKARENKLTVEDMDGGTFTISNGGVFGSMFGTPIINPPQSAILGMHAILDRPVAINGEVKIRPMMYIALTYDHRLIDGREAVTFLRKIKAGVEDPSIYLLGM